MESQTAQGLVKSFIPEWNSQLTTDAKVRLQAVADLPDYFLSPFAAETLAMLNGEDRLTGVLDEVALGLKSTEKQTEKLCNMFASILSWFLCGFNDEQNPGLLHASISCAMRLGPELSSQLAWSDEYPAMAGLFADQNKLQSLDFGNLHGF
ncbi:MAG: hypothetical protein LBJ92_00455 [Holosporales bacterium]|jgi:hypothetical protein|nr:hypothetical protein [Holosporales bacterium]